MAYFILLVVAVVLTMLFYLLVNFAKKRHLSENERKDSVFLQQVILRLFFAGIGFGMIF